MSRGKVLAAMAAGLGVISALAGAAVMGSGAGAARAATGPAGDCAALTSVQIDNGKIVSATSVKPPFQTPPIFMYTGTVRVPFCRVAGVLTPTPSSEIHFEVWLPEEGYTGRFAGVGNGGLTGAIFYATMSRMVNRGYAAYSSDRGHTGGGFDIAFATDPEKLIDFKERADHLATVAAKSVVATYYGEPARHAYWFGCSGGGVQGYTAAWLHPGDYDGIVAGAAPMLFKRDFVPGQGTPDMGAITGIAPILWKAPTLTKEKLDMVTKAALATCDAADGVKDGVINDPQSCKFDPASLICRDGQTTECLSKTEADVLNEAYAAGHSRGAEYYWKALGGGDGPNKVSQVMGEAMFVPTEQQQILEGFEARGGKMIAYVGLNDFPMPKMVKYEEELIAKHEKAGMTRAQAIAAVDKFHRLFLVPGMEHCAGGPGANNFSTPTQADRPPMGPDQDIVSALEAWVEQGEAPSVIVATKYNGDDPGKGIQMTRPLCLYPRHAKWSGKGDAADYRTFACVLPPKA
jgi:feruloyl esterase